MKVLSRFKYFLLSLLAGSLLILAFPYPDLSFLSFFGLIPLLIVSYQLPPVKSLLYGLLTGLIFFSGISYWISIYGYLPLVLLTLLMSLSVAIFAFLVSYVKNLPLGARLFFVPSIWVFLEFLRSEFGSWSFSYGVLGYSQHKFLLLLQFASILGVYGISFLVVMVNVALAEIISHSPRTVGAILIAHDEDKNGRINSPLRSIVGTLVVAVIFALVLGYGFLRLQEAAGGQVFAKVIRVAVVQVSIPQKLKWLSSEDGRIMDKYERATLKAAKGHPDLIVLPESALPAYVTEEDPLFQTVQDWARRAKTSVLAGIPFIGDDSKSYNTARLFSSDGRIVGTYAKIYPVPFGEFTPIRPVTEKIRPDATVRGDVAPGRKLTIFKIEKPVGADARPAEGGASVRPLKGPTRRSAPTSENTLSRFSVLLCSESSYSNLARRMVARGANMIFVLTNDAWFFETSESDQHFVMSKLRAVENGRYLVQAANSGVSGFVTPKGQVLKRSKLFEVTTLSEKVYFKDGKTPFTSYGYLFPYGTLFLILTGLFISTFRRYK